ncbi:hypothetical protein [Rhizobium leguminosarum]|uniref:hypothetical protein n=1 Tax=Rhizobium leguminosarum TaxID=384 RepID=UPI001C941178|nr:hypothetical protein [Rhizobium leguminosarum]MBY5701030.1 hypothetical protein [Rhizobium leguminosarum]
MDTSLNDARVRPIGAMDTARTNDQKPNGEVNPITGNPAQGQQVTEQKLFGISPEILISAILGAARAVIKVKDPNGFKGSLVSEAIKIAENIAQGQQLTEQKLFGISREILICAILGAARAVIKAKEPNEFEGSMVGEAIKIAGNIAQGQQLTEQKLFGISREILICAVLGAATAVIKG